MGICFAIIGALIFGFVLGFLCGRPDSAYTEEEPFEDETEEEFNKRIMQQW